MIVSRTNREIHFSIAKMPIPKREGKRWNLKDQARFIFHDIDAGAIFAKVAGGGFDQLVIGFAAREEFLVLRNARAVRR